MKNNQLNIIYNKVLKINKKGNNIIKNNSLIIYFKLLIKLTFNFFFILDFWRNKKSFNSAEFGLLRLIIHNNFE